MHISAEIPLLIFTLVAQLAVGIMIAGRLALAGSVDEKIQSRINSQGYFALIFICIGAFLSMLHLGTPSHAIFTVANIGSSWLSREIVMVLIVTLAIAAAALSVWKKASERAVQALAIIAAVLGIVLLYVMSRVYNSPFLPGWEGNATFFLFLASALILGSFWSLVSWVLGQSAANKLAMAHSGACFSARLQGLRWSPLLPPYLCLGLWQRLTRQAWLILQKA